MNIIRPTTKLHTIDEWMRLDPALRPVILANIKLKDRLWAWLKAQQSKELKPLDDPKWFPCHHCSQTGWVLHEPRYPGIHPSQIINVCELKIFWDMIGEAGSRSIEARMQLVFDFGTALHQLFQRYGAHGAWGPQYKAEVKISAEYQQVADDLMLEGSADAENILVLDSIPNASHIYEVGLVHEYKSMNSGVFKGLTRPKPAHKMQATIYAAALNRPIVVYLYMNKDDSNLADFPIAFEPDVWGAMSSKARKLKGIYDAYNAAVDNKQLPQLPPGSPGYDCNECSYVKTCHAFKESQQKRK